MKNSFTNIPYLSINFGEGLSQTVWLATKDDRFRAAVRRWDLDGNASFIENFLQGVSLGANHILMLRFLHFYCDSSGVLFLQ